MKNVAGCSWYINRIDGHKITEQLSAQYRFLVLDITFKVFISQKLSLYTSTFIKPTSLTGIEFPSHILP
jgi:hypothetical protein